MTKKKKDIDPLDVVQKYEDWVKLTYKVPLKRYIEKLLEYKVMKYLTPKELSDDDLDSVAEKMEIITLEVKLELNELYKEFKEAYE